jgi:ABC-2 type transport system permease protein
MSALQSSPQSPPQSPPYVAFSLRRVAALVLRHWYVIKSSWPRIFDLMYWPTVQMLMWGFLQLYVAEHSNFFARAAGSFIAAVILWDILFRGQLGFSISFLEEMYSRNMGNLMMSPLRPSEFVIALMTMSIIRLAIGTIPVTLLAIVFFGFNLWAMGLALAVFVCNLFLTGWSVGLIVAGMLLRQGLGAENLAWGIMFLFLPLVCVYYPVSVLPDWLQVFAWMLPPTYVFEGMRALLVDKVFRFDLMLQAFALNVVVFTLSTVAFLALLRSARQHGTLLQGGD